MQFSVDGCDYVSVRVHCEAPDCHALLEVTIDRYRCYDRPTIVRCGKCRRLLEVNLTNVLSPFSGPMPSYLFEGLPTEGKMSTWGETVSTGSRHLQDTTLKMHRPPVLIQSRDATITCNPMILNQERRTLNIAQFEKPPPLTRCLGHRSSTTMGTEKKPMHDGDMSEFRPTLLAGQSKSKNKKQKCQKGRKPSVYNIFMRQELKQILAADPTLDHRKAFKLAASKWMRAPNGFPCGRSREPISSDVSTVTTDDCWMDIPDNESHQLSLMELLKSECST